MKSKLLSLFRSRLIKNSFWGIAANGLQSVLLSLFFVIVARKYTTGEFAFFLIANTIYQFLAAFSTLGLGQWFTRELVDVEDKQELVSRFLKIQLYSGCFFYICNVGVAFLLYKEPLLQSLIVLLGINIVFDNFIYGIKCLNIAEFNQNKTFKILIIDSVLKFAIGCLLFLFPFSIMTLSVLLIIVRFITLNFFLSVGSSKTVSLRSLWNYKLAWSEVKKIVFANWPFIIIGSVSIAYWRISNIIISKTLPLADVAHFEISFRVFSIAQILPLIVSMSVFPGLVQQFKTGILHDFRNYYSKVFNYYLLFGLFSYTFIYSFADTLIPWAFGSAYNITGVYTKEMFLTILIFPTALLQANVLVAMNMERADMWFNVVSLVLNIIFCFTGFLFAKNLTTVNLAIFFSFLVFHICQDVLLVRKGMITIGHVLKFYVLTGLLVGAYILLSYKLPPVALFTGFWLLVALAFVKFPAASLQLAANRKPENSLP
ncbi:oligosaccharide flippase family protein [Niastella sp. OAS944]|uniref:oligosaccharide flippase family protein n=1 Tax=Niastella sp. OAS944 TaxID=2664089 RepID=UPI00348580AF|nr:O-antigen/teichoic acid export membrane protein [Chitinophagaceae bacterium OAS944]